MQSNSSWHSDAVSSIQCARAVWERIEDVEEALEDPATLWQKLRGRWADTDAGIPQMHVIMRQGVVAKLSLLKLKIMNPCGQTGGMCTPKTASYRTTNWSACNDTLRKRGSLMIWLDNERAWHTPHEGRPGKRLSNLRHR